MKYAAPACALGAALFFALALMIGSWKQLSVKDTKRKRAEGVKYGLMGAKAFKERKNKSRTKSASYSKAIKEAKKGVKSMKKWARKSKSKSMKKAVKKAEKRLSGLQRARIFGLLTFLFLILGILLLIAAGVAPLISDKLAGKENLIKTIATWPPVGLAVLLFLFWILFYTGIDLGEKPKKIPDHISYSAGLGFSSILFILGFLGAAASGVLTKVLGDKE